MKPHIHQKKIIAWANGAQIQYQDTLGEWTDIDRPAWSEDTKYRVKPEPVEALQSFLDTYLINRMYPSKVVASLLIDKCPALADVDWNKS